MTIESQQIREPYSGNGTTTAFSFPHRFLDEDDLTVILRDSDGVETVQTITTHYTVSGAGDDNGGTVNMVTAPASGEELTILADPDLVQDLDLKENNTLPPEDVEKRFDKLTIIAQRLKDLITRSVRLTDGLTDTFDPKLPAVIEPGKALVVNEDGDGFIFGAGADAIDQAQTYAESAETSASTAETQATTATTQAAAAEAAAQAAQAAVASALWTDVVFKTNADSPIAITDDDRGKLFAIDCSDGDVVVNLPEIADLDLDSPWALGIKKTDSSGNAITVNRAGTDTVDGETLKTLGSPDAGATFIPDTDPTLDEWTSTVFGAATASMNIDTFSGNGVNTEFTLTRAPGQEENTWVYISGVYQQKGTYSVSGTTLTFGTAPASGTDNIEVITGSTVSVGTPADNSVTKDSLTNDALNKTVVEKSAAYSLTSDDQVVLGDASSAAFTLTLPAAASNEGRIFDIKKTDSSFNAVTIDGNSSETIDGETSTTLDTQYESIQIVSDGTNWHILRRDIPSEWTAYTTSWTAETTAPAIGNGALSARWIREGAFIRINISLLAGTTTTFGSGDWFFSLPTDLAVDNLTTQDPHMAAVRCKDTSTGTMYFGALHSELADGLTKFKVETHGATGPLSSSVPFTWASTDRLSIDALIPIDGWKGN